jgi:glutathione peroxidase
MKVLFGLIAALLTAQTTPTGSAKVPAALNFTMDSLAGKPVNLSKYQGNVVLMVNVASECGYTPQYAGLETLHKKYAGKGLRIL